MLLLLLLAQTTPTDGLRNCRQRDVLGTIVPYYCPPGSAPSQRKSRGTEPPTPGSQAYFCRVRTSEPRWFISGTFWSAQRPAEISARFQRQLASSAYTFTSQASCMSGPSIAGIEEERRKYMGYLKSTFNAVTTVTFR
jgi:hypothetical protein